MNIPALGIDRPVRTQHVEIPSPFDPAHATLPTPQATDPPWCLDAPLLLEAELAERWRLSPRTLQRWRQTAIGPPYLRLGRRILYRMFDVLEFERSALHDHEARLDARRRPSSTGGHAP